GASLGAQRGRWPHDGPRLARAVPAQRDGQDAGVERSHYRRGPARQYPGRRSRRPAMTVPAGQLTALADAIAAVAPLSSPADVALRDFFRQHRQLGARDRAFVAEGVFALLRRRRSLTIHAGTSAPRSLAIAACLREL